MNTYRCTAERSRLLFGIIIFVAMIAPAASATGSGSSYTVGGAIAGLVGQGLTLENGNDYVSPNPGDQTFTFNTAVPAGTQYDVSVQLQPAGQTCKILGGSGVVGQDDVTDVQVNCTSTMYTIGGTITGLTAQGLILADGSQTLNVSPGDSTFTFPTSEQTATSFKVTVASQPNGQTCVVSNGVGVILTSAVNNVSITCKAAN